MAKLTFTVNGINPLNPQFMSVSFLVKSEGEADAATKNLAGINLIFPHEVGKEFEIDDSFSLEIAPTAEGKH